MADKKISDLTSLSAADVALADIIPIVDVTAGATKGITYGSLYSAITSAAGLVATSTGIKFPSYTSTATASGLTSINPIQNNVPADGVGNDTTTDLAVDQTGNVVRTTQEATWLLTKAQIDGLAAGSSGAVTLIQAPGANKFVLVEKATFLINYVWNGGNMNTGQSYNIQQDGNRTNNIAILPAPKILDIVKEGQSSGNSDTYGIYEADNGYSILNRTYKPDKAITFSKNTANILATAVTSITIKIRYRVYDVASF